MRQKTKIAQTLPNDLDHNVASIRRFIIGMRKRNRHPLHCNGNMNETPLNFYIVANRTVDIKGAKAVQVRGTGHEVTRFSVVLSYVADGTKLKPKVIFFKKIKA